MMQEHILSSPLTSTSEAEFLACESDSSEKRGQLEWKLEHDDKKFKVVIFVQNQIEVGEVKPDQTVEESRAFLKILQQLLHTGGWTVAVLIGFRIAIVPLIAVGNSTVILVLTVAISVFLVLRAVAQIIRELQQPS